MLTTIFAQQYNASPEIEVKSPGRINVIGEHTDYNEGFVLPAAIDKYCHVAIGKRNDDIVNLYAVEFNERFEVELSRIAPIKGKWTNYVLGVVDQLVKRGIKLSGFNLALTSNIPVGAGLSSSAAIECAVCYALDRLFTLNLSKLEMAKISQIAEHTFPGVQCGIMDQFASIFGKKDHALKLDCRTLEHEEVPLILEGYHIVLLNTNVSHSLASSAYNDRRRECTEGVALVSKHVNNVSSLRDVTVDMLNKYVKDQLIYKRCRFIVEENDRVHKAVQQMKIGDINGLGEQMYRSHDGLSKEYEVSCAELDWLVNAVRDNDNVAGARMMGGGFGGCTINIVREEAVDHLVADLSKRYKQAFNKELSVYQGNTADGAHVL